jgi:hypothetical protein
MKTKQDFEDATAFELLLLQTILNAGESSSKEIIDLADSSGGITRHLCSEIALSDNDVNALKVKFIPLGFGAGWKVIDLMIEHEIALAGLLTPSRGYLPISTKKEVPVHRPGWRPANSNAGRSLTSARFLLASQDETA